MKKEILAEKLGENHGPYSHGIVSGGFVFTTQIGTLPNGAVISDDVYEQTKQLINNAKCVLEDVGATLDHVVKVTIYIIDLKKNLPAMNKAYREFMPNHPFPARACVEVTAMVDEGVFVEMEFTAHIAD